MPFSALDIVVLGITLISAVLAAVRGFSREILSIAAWAVAVLAAWLLHKSLLPFTSQYISHQTIALVVTVAVIFIVTLLIMSLITVQISDLVLDSRIGAVDRTLGLVFGLARGLLISVLGWLLLITMVNENKVPEWTANAKSLPFLQSSAKSLRDSFDKNAKSIPVVDQFLNKPSGGTDVPPPESTQSPAGTTQ